MWRPSWLNSRSRRVSAACVVLAVTWWQFGITVHRSEKMVVVLQRVFGRVTRIHILDPQLREAERIFFPWANPFDGGHGFTACELLWPEHWSDRNADGRWDTWVKKIDPDPKGGCSAEYRVDTTGTGKADWVFLKSADESNQAWEDIVARRGF